MDKLTEILLQNYDEYWKDLLQKEKIIIIYNSYETAIKATIAHYNNWHWYLPEQIYDKLTKMQNPLDFLYNEYLKSDNANIVNELIVVFEGLQI